MFLSKKGKRLSRRAMERVVEKRVNQAGLEENHTIHSLRHTFAMNLRKKGVDTEVIQKLLGHASLASTGIYTQASREELEEAVESL